MKSTVMKIRAGQWKNNTFPNGGCIRKGRISLVINMKAKV